MRLESFSTTRRKPPLPEVKRNHCKWCGCFLKGDYAREFCNRPEGRDCYQRFSVAAKPDYAREAVFKRDRGICCGCGINVSAPEVIGWKPGMLIRDHEMRPMWISGARHCGDMVKIIPVTKLRWEVDHIIPLWSAPKVLTLAQRDAYWGLKNMQTLCKPCHVRKTTIEAAQRKSLATRTLAA